MSEESESSGAEDTTEEQTENDAEEENFKTVLYAMTREALTADDLETLSENLPENFRLKPSEDGDNIMFQRKEETGSSIDVKDVLSN